MNDNRKKESILKMNFIALKYVFKFCPMLVVFSVFNIIASVMLSLSEVEIINKAINAVVNGEEIKVLIDALTIHVIIVIVCSIFKNIYNRYLENRYRIIYRKKMLTFLYSKVKHIDMASYDNPEFYDRYSRAVNDSSWRGIAVYSNFAQFVQNICVSIALGAYIVITDIYLIIIVIISALVNILVVNKTNKAWYENTKKTENERRFSGYIKRTFYQQQYAAEIKTTPISDLLIDRYHEKVDTMEKKYMNTEKSLLPANIGFRFCNNLIQQAGTYIYLTIKLFDGLMDVALFTSTANAAFKFFSNFIGAISVYTTLRQHSYYIGDFIWVTEYEPKVETNSGITEIEEFNGFKVENVTFSYPGNNYNSLENVTINLNKNERIAIVGDNGGGKTTFIKMLLRFYDPKEGRILYNDIDLREYNENKIRNEYSVVFQDFQIYALSIAENVLMRRCITKEDEELVLNALDYVGMKERIVGLKKGIFTKVTREFEQSGETFSGGERQRLAIARVFASNAKVYILDEPTSALDPFAEEKINKLILSKAKDKTIIIIAHRLSTVVDADKIYLIRKGHVVEQGTHKELMKLNGIYSEMFNTQKSLYIKKEEA